jgi:hypothetical protein
MVPGNKKKMSTVNYGRRIPIEDSSVYVLWQRWSKNKMKTKKYHTVGTIQNSIANHRNRGKIDILSTHTHNCSLSLVHIHTTAHSP